jgi:hypothetical protein
MDAMGELVETTRIVDVSPVTMEATIANFIISNTL